MKSIVLLLAMGMGAWGQQQSTCSAGHETWTEAGGWCHANPKERIPVAKPAPLKCGKWQHVASDSYEIVPRLKGSGYINREVVTCADDIHPLTEREWQELMARLRKLEHPAMTLTVDGSTADDCTVPPDDPKKPCDANQPSRKKKALEKVKN